MASAVFCYNLKLKSQCFQDLHIEIIPEAAAINSDVLQRNLSVARHDAAKLSLALASERAAAFRLKAELAKARKVWFEVETYCLRRSSRLWYI